MNEMSKLIALLETAHVPYETRPHWFGSIQIGYPNFENTICDVVCFRGSYGYEQGLLEIMGLVDEEEVGEFFSASSSITDTARFKPYWAQSSGQLRLLKK